MTVNLYASDGTTWLAATATDGSGLYQFVGLANGTYVVKVDTATLPAGYTATGEGDPGTACGGGCDNTITATVSGGGTNNTVDFGYYNSTSYPISGNVFNDLTNLGVKDVTDTGLTGIKVYLYDSTGTTLLATATTDGSGNYTFPGMPNGTYRIKVDTTTLPSASFTETYESDSSINNAIQATVSGGPSINNDFGFHEYPGSIAGSVCSGLPSNLCAAGDGKVPGITVQATWAGPDGILGTTDDQVFTQVTDANGAYTFTGLQPGAYQLTTLNPAGDADQ